MKKLLAILMVLTMVIAFGAVASAADATLITKLDKTYTVTGSETIKAPVETLSFEVTADDNNPDDSLITIAPVAVDGSSKEVEIPFTLPKYTNAGVYKYTVTETDGKTQGETYSTDTIAISVLVDFKEDGTLQANAYAAKASDDATEKLTAFENEYKLGKLTVTKEIDGNLADPTDEFDFTITFTAESGKTVRSAFSYSVAGGEKVTVAPGDSGWTTKEIQVTLKGGNSVNFEDLPEGLTYTVEEADYTTGNINTKNYGYEAPVKENETGSISSKAAVTCTFTNVKDLPPETGISLDSLPYILLAVLAVAAVAVLVIRKRRYSEE